MSGLHPGGLSPIWHPGGRELGYRSGRAVVSAPVSFEGKTFRYGNPEALYEGDYVPEVVAVFDARSYALASDGQWFLMIKETAGNAAPLESATSSSS